MNGFFFIHHNNYNGKKNISFKNTILSKRRWQNEFSYEGADKLIRKKKNILIGIGGKGSIRTRLIFYKVVIIRNYLIETTKVETTTISFQLSKVKKKIFGLNIRIS